MTIRNNDPFYSRLSNTTKRQIYLKTKFSYSKCKKKLFYNYINIENSTKIVGLKLKLSKQF